MDVGGSNSPVKFRGGGWRFRDEPKSKETELGLEEIVGPCEEGAAGQRLAGSVHGYLAYKKTHPPRTLP